MERFPELLFIEGGGRGGVGINANDSDDLDSGGKKKWLHARMDVYGIRKQFDGSGKKRDAFRFWIEVLKVFRVFPGPINQPRPGEAMRGAVGKVKPRTPKNNRNHEQ